LVARNRNIGRIGLAAALFLVTGAFTAATPGRVSAAVIEVKCDDVDAAIGLTLEDGESVECVATVNNDEAAIRIQPEGQSENPVTLATLGLADLAGDPGIIVSLLQNHDPDDNADTLDVLFEYRCIAGFNDSILVEQAGTLPFGFLRFPIKCLGVNLSTTFPPSAPDTFTHGIGRTLIVSDEDDNGPLAVDLIDPNTGVLRAAFSRVAGSNETCPVTESGSRHLQVDTDGCDADTVNEDLIVFVLWVPECPTVPVDVRIGAKRMGSDEVETVTCLPAAGPIVLVPPAASVTPPVTVIMPPSTGDAGLVSPSGKDSTSLFVIAAAVAAVLVGFATLHLARQRSVGTKLQLRPWHLSTRATDSSS
jgi:hypothetical protein